MRRDSTAIGRQRRLSAGRVFDLISAVSSNVMNVAAYQDCIASAVRWHKIGNLEKWLMVLTLDRRSAYK